MQDKQLFEYAVIRVVPKVERSEFINIGVVVYCAKQKFLDAKFNLDEKRLGAFSDGIDIQSLQEYMNVYQQICKGGKDAGAIGKLPMPERFHWLTATRSTVLQSSPVHTGLSSDAAAELNKLFDKLVL